MAEFNDTEAQLRQVVKTHLVAPTRAARRDQTADAESVYHTTVGVLSQGDGLQELNEG
jgi:hypothetical protein